MTDEQILQLAENFKFCRHDEDDIRDWKVTPSLILEFARTIYQNGYHDGAVENAEPSWLGQKEMTTLSPQTQTIIDAADEVFSHGGTIREGFAAALRVLADNVAPENYACFSGHREWDEALETRNESIREAILDIATELEAL